MNYLARELAHTLAKYANDSFYEDEIRYGIEIALGALLQILLIVLIAVLLGIGKPVLAIIITAVLYKRYSGGPHCNAYYRCTITSLINFIALGYLASFIPVNYLPMYTAGLALLTVFVIHIYVPVDNPINVIDDDSIRRKHKQKSYIVLLLLLVIIMIGYVMGQKLIIISILLGLLWQNFTLLPLGQKYIHLWDHLFDRIELLFKGEEVMKC